MSAERLTRLRAYLREWRGRPYALGTTDCVTFVAQWLDRETGGSYERAVREKYNYSTPGGVLRCLAEAGGYERLVNQELGGMEQPELPQAGDVVMFAGGDGREVLGLSSGLLQHAPSLQGLVAVGVDRVSRVWRVPSYRR